MLVNGFIVAGVGMTAVFLFLGIMTLAIGAVGVIMQRLALRSPETPARTDFSGSSSGREEDIAIILAAVRAQARG